MFPREWKAYSKWRKAQQFPPDMEVKARLVENDLRLIDQIDPVLNTNVIVLCERNIQDFAEKLKAQG